MAQSPPKKKRRTQQDENEEDSGPVTPYRVRTPPPIGSSGRQRPPGLMLPTATIPILNFGAVSAEDDYAFVIQASKIAQQKSAARQRTLENQIQFEQEAKKELEIKLAAALKTTERIKLEFERECATFRDAQQDAESRIREKEVFLKEYEEKFTEGVSLIKKFEHKQHENQELIGRLTQDINDLLQQRERHQNKIADLSKDLTENEEEKERLRNQLAIANAEIASHLRNLKLKDEEKEVLNRRITAANNEIADFAEYKKDWDSSRHRMNEEQATIKAQLNQSEVDKNLLTREKSDFEREKHLLLLEKVKLEKEQVNTRDQLTQMQEEIVLQRNEKIQLQEDLTREKEELKKIIETHLRSIHRLQEEVTDLQTHPQAAADPIQFEEPLPLPLPEQPEYNNFDVPMGDDDNDGHIEERQEVEEEPIREVQPRQCDWSKKYGTKTGARPCDEGEFVKKFHHHHGTFMICQRHTCIAAKEGCRIMIKPSARKCSACCRSDRNKEDVKLYDAQRKSKTKRRAKEAESEEAEEPPKVTEEPQHRKRLMQNQRRSVVSKGLYQNVFNSDDDDESD